MDLLAVLTDGLNSLLCFFSTASARIIGRTLKAGDLLKITTWEVRRKVERNPAGIEVVTSVDAALIILCEKLDTPPAVMDHSTLPFCTSDEAWGALSPVRAVGVRAAAGAGGGSDSSSSSESTHDSDSDSGSHGGDSDLDFGEGITRAYEERRDGELCTISFTCRGDICTGAGGLHQDRCVTAGTAAITLADMAGTNRFATPDTLEQISDGTLADTPEGLGICRHIAYYWYARDIFDVRERTHLPWCVIACIRSRWPSPDAVYKTWIELDDDDDIRAAAGAEDEEEEEDGENDDGAEEDDEEGDDAENRAAPSYGSMD